jgi:S1-C subfamily serine protease
MALLFRRLITTILAAAACGLPAPGFSQEPEQIFKAAQQFTVKVQTIVSLPFGPDEEKGVFTGAGFVVDAKKGWILTNAHVVSRSPASIRIALYDGSVSDAKRIYVDPYLDLAVAEISDSRLLPRLTQAPFECRDIPETGHPVGAFGHPWTIPFIGTRGIISGMNEAYERGALMTDAPISPGNSGGPLVSLRHGRVVGVNTAGMDTRRAQNLNFAVSIKYACRIISLLDSGRDPSPPDGLLVFYSDPRGTELRVARNFMPDGTIPIEPNDVVKGVVGEDEQPQTETDFYHLLRGRLPEVALRVERKGREVTIHGRLPQAESLLERRGVYASGVLFGSARQYDAREVNFGKVSACYVEKGSLGEAAGLQKTEVIEAIGGEPVSGIEDVYAGLSRAMHENKAAVLQVKHMVGAGNRSFFQYWQVILPVRELKWAEVR